MSAKYKTHIAILVEEAFAEGVAKALEQVNMKHQKPFYKNLWVRSEAKESLEGYLTAPTFSVKREYSISRGES